MNIIVSPFIKIIEVFFIKILDIINNPGFSLLALSLTINIILLPLYHIADKIEKKEKNIQNLMKPKIEEFKEVYKGYELHLYIKNVYRLNNYHPIYALRGLLSLLIQVPFFIGAYTYLSNYPGFQGFSFLGISDLSRPDHLLGFGKLSINILPFIMTAMNLLSGLIYTSNMQKMEKINVYIIAIFFLLLLYNSPASLLIYWTFNNIFSLFKNIIYLKFNINDKSMGGI